MRWYPSSTPILIYGCILCHLLRAWIRRNGSFFLYTLRAVTIGEFEILLQLHRIQSPRIRYMVPIHKIQHRSRKRVACACRIDCLHLLRLRMRSGRSGKSIRSFASAGEQHQTDTPYQQFFQYAFDLRRSRQEFQFFIRYPPAE